jgi:hypothetical protein
MWHDTHTAYVSLPISITAGIFASSTVFAKVHRDLTFLLQQQSFSLLKIRVEGDYNEWKKFH